MATLQEIRQNPETLGNPVTDEDVQLFVDAVKALMEEGLDEQEAIDRVWGDGDWVPRAMAIVQPGDGGSQKTKGERAMAPQFRTYTYHNPSSLPVNWDDTYGLDGDAWDAIARAAGFDPDDEEASAGRLTEDWNGHKAGAIVVAGLLVEGHPFAVEVNAEAMV